MSKQGLGNINEGDAVKDEPIVGSGAPFVPAVTDLGAPAPALVAAPVPVVASSIAPTPKGISARGVKRDAGGAALELAGAGSAKQPVEIKAEQSNNNASKKVKAEPVVGLGAPFVPNATTRGTTAVGGLSSLAPIAKGVSAGGVKRDASSALAMVGTGTKSAEQQVQVKHENSARKRVKSEPDDAAGAGSGAGVAAPTSAVSAASAPAIAWAPRPAAPAIAWTPRNDFFHRRDIVTAADATWLKNKLLIAKKDHWEEKEIADALLHNFFGRLDQEIMKVILDSDLPLDGLFDRVPSIFRYCLDARVVDILYQRYKTLFPQSEYKLLNHIVQTTDLDVIKSFLELRNPSGRRVLDVNAQDKRGYNSLMILLEVVSRKDHSRVKAILDLLFSNGLDVNAVNKIGKAALHLCFLHDNDLAELVVPTLIEAGADPNLLTDAGHCALYHAIQKRVKPGITALLPFTDLGRFFGDPREQPLTALEYVNTLPEGGHVKKDIVINMIEAELAKRHGSTAVPADKLAELAAFKAKAKALKEAVRRGDIAGAGVGAPASAAAPRPMSAGGGSGAGVGAPASAAAPRPMSAGGASAGAGGGSSRATVASASRSPKNPKLEIVLETLNHDLPSLMLKDGDAQIVRGYEEKEGKIIIKADGDCLFNAVLLLTLAEYPAKLKAAFPRREPQDIDHMSLRSAVVAKLASKQADHPEYGLEEMVESIEQDINMLYDPQNDPLSKYSPSLTHKLKKIRDVKGGMLSEEVHEEIKKIGCKEIAKGYRKALLKSGFFAGNLELTILNEVLGLTICVRQLNSYNIYSGDPSAERITIFFNDSHDHYDAIVSYGTSINIQRPLLRNNPLLGHDDDGEDDSLPPKLPVPGKRAPARAPAPAVMGDFVDLELEGLNDWLALIDDVAPGSTRGGGAGAPASATGAIGEHTAALLARRSSQEIDPANPDPAGGHSRS